MTTPTKRGTERALLAAGLTRRQARRLLAGGWVAAFGPDAEADEARPDEELRHLLARLAARLEQND